MSTTYLELNKEITETTDTVRSTIYLELNIEIKDTTDTARSTTYIELNKEITKPQTQLGLQHTLS